MQRWLIILLTLAFASCPLGAQAADKSKKSPSKTKERIISVKAKTMRIKGGAVILRPGSSVSVQLQQSQNGGTWRSRWLGGSQAVKALERNGWVKLIKTSTGKKVYAAQKPYFRYKPALGTRYKKKRSTKVPSQANTTYTPPAEGLYDQPSLYGAEAERMLFGDPTQPKIRTFRPMGNVMGLPAIMHNKKMKDLDMQRREEAIEQGLDPDDLPDVKPYQ